MVYCPNCGNFVEDNSAYCTRCGVSIKYDKEFCTYCGSTVETNESFCPNCGAQVVRKSRYQSNTAATVNAQPYSYQNNGISSRLKGIGITCIILAFIAGLLAIIMLFMVLTPGSVTMTVGSYTPDEETTQLFLVLSCLLYIALAVMGGIAANCCMKRKNYGRGLAMMIVALIINIVNGTLVGLIIAIVLLVLYTKSKYEWLC